MFNLLNTKLEDIGRVMSLRSSVLSEYFYMLMTNHNIKSIRNGIKVLLFYLFGEIISSHMSERGTVYRPSIAFIVLCCFFIIFLSTINVRRTDIMVRLAAIIVAMSMGYTVLLASDLFEIMETHYSLSVVIILMMYTLFRLKFLMTMLLSIIYIMLFVSIANFRIKFLENTNMSMFSSAPSLAKTRIFKTGIKQRQAFIVGQCILFSLTYMTGLYLRFFNSIRRKSAFLKLAQNAEAKLKTNNAQQVQMHWIEAIMPASVKDEFQKRSGSIDRFDLIYCQKFENVSILFADIVGFTAMSSNKSAPQLVFLLNDLYNRFDEHGKITNCEKLGTLGDCYYCVAGCPVPRQDHAMGAIEMGIGMCKMILRFNKEHKEKVNMRVGVHSGVVIAAIIGNHRFRFDVFSNDVMIANALESSGRPGLVHISENTQKLVRYAFQFEFGDILEVKKEQQHGLSGLIQVIVPIKTYFVIVDHTRYKSKRRSDYIFDNSDVSKLTSKSTLGKPQLNASNQMILMNSDTRKIIVQPGQAKNIFQLKDEKFKGDLNLIRQLQKDPERPVQFFQNPPLSPITLCFTDKEIEYQYLYHTTDQVEKINVESTKIALLFDCIACLFYSTFIIAAAVTMLPNGVTMATISFLVYCSGFLTTIISAFISLLYRSEIKNKIIGKIYDFFSHPAARLVLSIYISSMPSLVVLSIYQPQHLHEDYQYTCAYFSLTLFALIGNCLFTSSSSLVKQVVTLIFTFIPMYLINMPVIAPPDTEITVFNSCFNLLKYQFDIHRQRLQCNFTFQLIHIYMLIYYLTRENEKNIRINFYATREADIKNAEASRAKNIAEGLLYNIIPKHVFTQIVGNKWNDQKEITFSYAHALSNAGVVFASISNFFSIYYREDYKNGIVALKLLHTIICIFDNLLMRPYYQDKLEKIKTINDCYMLASGLNSAIQSNKNDEHLIALMYFAFDMHYNLHLFNLQNMIGPYRFSLKIGYNFGPITAGIIGTTKPLYDIWGDTVNVASRMYSTVPPDNIQVPNYVVSKLKEHFEFLHRGLVPIKGKGQMETYLAIRCYEKQKLYVRTYSYPEHAEFKPQSLPYSLSKMSSKAFEDSKLNSSKLSFD